MSQKLVTIPLLNTDIVAYAPKAIFEDIKKILNEFKFVRVSHVQRNITAVTGTDTLEHPTISTSSWPSIWFDTVDANKLLAE